MRGVMSWLETYRGTVYRWEVDNVDHFTVAFYFTRLEDATAALLHAIGLDAGTLAGSGQMCVTVDCRVHYRRELRVGDILHIRSGVLAADREGLRIVHEVVDAADGTVCTTVLQGLALVDRGGRTRRHLSTAQQQAAPARRGELAEIAEGRPRPALAE